MSRGVKKFKFEQAEHALVQLESQATKLKVFVDRWRKSPKKAKPIWIEGQEFMDGAFAKLYCAI